MHRSVSPRYRKTILHASLMLGLLGSLSGCFSSSGGGSSPPDRNGTVVLPPGGNAVCQDGSAPPCP